MLRLVFGIAAIVLGIFAFASFRFLGLPSVGEAGLAGACAGAAVLL